MREFIAHAFSVVHMPIAWQGNGMNEQGYEVATGRVLVDVDPQFFRPAEVNVLLGDSSKARKQLGWTPKHSFADLVRDMIEQDIGGNG